MFTKELFLIIPTHMVNREIIPGRKKEGSTVSSINCDCCRQLDLAVSSLPAALALVGVIIIIIIIIIIIY